MQRLRVIWLVMATVMVGLLWAAGAQAAIDTTAEHAILMDGDTGQVLWVKDGFAPMPPASMSKLMTLELLFQQLKDGRVKLTDTFPVSERAWRTQGSKTFVMVNTRVPVEALIRGIIIQSGNDACVVVAETLGGSVEAFVDMMNARAKKLGLMHSHFVNPNGLPDPPGQLMSAYDLATLARHLIRDYPAYYHYFGEKSFVWNNITQMNRNTVLEKFPGADGLKTGHTDASGYGIVASGVRAGQRLILVVNGLRYPQFARLSNEAQDWHAEQLRGEEASRVLEIAFREFRHYQLLKPDEIVGQAQVWQGASATVPLKVAAPVNVTMEASSRADMKVTLVYDGPVPAPVAAGQQIGKLKITAPDFPGAEVPVYSAVAVPSAGFFDRIFLGLQALISGRHAAQ
jgi:serine-type D-Ala-D-Ala carboxypeptidase (penicillin-binding protein 5/6)